MQMTYKDTYTDLINEWNESLFLQSRKENYTTQLKKLNLSEDETTNLVNLILNFNNTKKELMAVKWLRSGAIKLPDDNEILNKAADLAQKYKIDYQQFTSPAELIHSVETQEQKSTAVHNHISPDDVPQFSHKCQHGNGIVTYWVEESKKAQEAVRKMIDQDWGYDANPWCLAARIDNSLKKAEHYWFSVYTDYPKRIAFKDGKLFAFSANNKPEIAWWDRKDHSWSAFPQQKVKEDEIIDKDWDYWYLLLSEYEENLNCWNLWDDILIHQPDVPMYIIEKLAIDEDHSYWAIAADSPKLPIKYMYKFAQNNVEDAIKYHLIESNGSRLPIEVVDMLLQEAVDTNESETVDRLAYYVKLTHDQINKICNYYTKHGYSMTALIENKNLPVQLFTEFIDKSEYLDSPEVEAISKRADLPQQIVEKLSNSSSPDVQLNIIKNNKLSPQLLKKIYKDFDGDDANIEICKAAKQALINWLQS